MWPNLVCLSLRCRFSPDTQPLWDMQERFLGDWLVTFPFLIPLLDRRTHTNTSCAARCCLSGESGILKTSEMPVTWRQQGERMTWRRQKKRLFSFFLSLHLVLRWYLSPLWSNWAVMKMLTPTGLRFEFRGSPGYNNPYQEALLCRHMVNTTCIPFHLCFLCLCHSELRCSIKTGSRCCGFSSAFDKGCLALGLSADILRACAAIQHEHSLLLLLLLLVERKDLCSSLD